MTASAFRCPTTSMAKAELDSGKIDFFLLIDGEEIPET
jgi:hypothetical protein